MESPPSRLHTALLHAFKHAANLSIPRGSLPAAKYFWNASLNDLRLNKNWIRRAISARQASGLPSDRLHSTLRRVSHKYSSSIRSATLEAWKTFTSKLSTGTRLIWKVVKSMSVGCTVPQGVDIEGEVGITAANKYATYLTEDIYRSRLPTATRSQWRLRAHHDERFTRWSSEQAQVPPCTQLPEAQLLDYHQFSPFRLEEYKRALHRLKNTSAPGPDSLPAKLLREASDQGHVACLKLINISFTTTTVPHQ